MKLSDYVVKFFENLNVSNVFMVSGGGCMHLVDSFGRSSKIKYVATQHEQAAAMAAEAFSKYKNDLGLVLATSGPGATNTVTGILDCWQDSVPVVYIFGQAKSRQTCQNSGIPNLRQFGVQEANIIPIVQSITKYAVEIFDASTIKYHLEKAISLAKTGRPGPVVLSIPIDIQSANVNENELIGYSNDNLPKTTLTEEELGLLVSAIKNSKRPVIIGGHGVRLSGAIDELIKLVHSYHIPVVTPIMGIDILPGEDQCNIGRVGTKGTRAGNFAMQNADLIISIGSRLSVSVIGYEYNLFAREAKVIVIDIDKTEHLKKTIEIEKLLQADANSALHQLNCAIEELENPSFDFSDWLNVCNSWKKKYPIILDEYDNDLNGINYYKFIDLLNHYSSSNSIYVSDAGSSFYVVAQSVNIKEKQRHITTGGTATMGFSVPASIGASIASGNDIVLSVTGEGSFMQNMQEMETIKYHHMNIKTFVMCNEGYFSIHKTQNKFFNGNYVGAGEESGISFTNLEKLSNAFDVKYFKISNLKEAHKLIPQILETSGPVIVEVKVDPNMEVIPTNAAMMKENGELVSKPLEDMYPFLPREEFNENMIIKPVDE